MPRTPARELADEEVLSQFGAVKTWDPLSRPSGIGHEPSIRNSGNYDCFGREIWADEEDGSPRE